MTSPNVFDPQKVCAAAAERAQEGSLSVAELILRQAIGTVATSTNVAYRQVWGPVVDGALANTLRLEALNIDDTERQAALLGEAAERLDHAASVSSVLYNNSKLTYAQAVNAGNDRKVNGAALLVQERASVWGEHVSFLGRVAGARMLCTDNPEVRLDAYRTAQTRFRIARNPLKESKNAALLLGNDIHALYTAQYSGDRAAVKAWLEHTRKDVRFAMVHNPHAGAKAWLQMRKYRNATYVSQALHTML